MDGTKGSYGTQRARLRQQLLESDSNLGAMDNAGPVRMPRMEGPYMGPVSQMNGSSGSGVGYYPDYNEGFDPMAPSSVRKGSITSLSVLSASKLFRRNKGDGGFDDDSGADIQHLMHGSNVSFDDISRIQDRGPYFMNATKSMDTTPFIPTLGPGNSLGKNLSSVQYRKQMNHQKKLMMSNSARAMSLNAPNPMQQQVNPRAMSLSTNNPMVPHTMSLGGNHGPNGPRTMSLLNRPPYDPRAMSMRSYQAAPRFHPGLPGPAMPSNFKNPRSQSLTGYLNYGNPNHGNQYYMQQGNYPHIPPNGQPNMRSPMAPPNSSNYQASERRINNRAPMPGVYSSHPRPAPPNSSAMMSNQPYVQKSNDSLMNVVVEEEPHTQHEFEQKFPNEDEEVLRSMEPIRETDISRQSSLRRTSSVRVRKLNFFSDPSTLSEHDVDEAEAIANSRRQSPTFNADYEDFNRNSVIQGRSDEESSLENQKLSALRNSAINKSPDKEMFSTAPDLLSPSKIKDINDGTSVSPDRGMSNTGPNAETSPVKTNQSNKAPSKQPSIKSLVENTAFDRFRNTTGESFNSLISDTKGEDGLQDIEEKYSLQTIEDIGQPYSHSQLDESKASSSYGSHTSKEDIGITPPSTGDSFNGKLDYHKESKKAIQSTDAYGNAASFSNSNMTKPAEESPFIESDTDKKKGHKASRSFSLGNKSKNIFKRLSLQSRKTSSDEQNMGIPSNSLRKSSFSVSQSPRVASSKGFPAINNGSVAPIRLTKEDLGIISCNNDLMNELKLITSELAASIKREIAFENNLDITSKSSDKAALHSQIVSQSKIISDLQEKLNKERDLRFICEEQVLLYENGASPSPLKINYEKAEIYQQLVIKNGLVNQLQNKVRELKSSNKQESHKSLLDKYNELVKENSDLKFNVIPNLEKTIEDAKVINKAADTGRRLNLVNGEQDSVYDVDYDQSEECIEIDTLKTQRDELREVIGILTTNYKRDLKNAQDKVKALEEKLDEKNGINEKLTRYLESNHSSKASSPTHAFRGNNGGKLQGFTIVSPTKKLFDE